jgi:aspartate kinase
MKVIKIGLVTDGKFGDATAEMPKTSQNLHFHLDPLLKEGMIVLVPGFFGVSDAGDITTFGRGGSDYSAAVVAAALGAEVLEVWKDVPGYMSADPRFVPSARLISLLAYDEAAELSYFGAKILHPRTVEPLRKASVNIEMSSFGPSEVALYFIVRQKDLRKAVEAIHATFFLFEP